MRKSSSDGLSTISCTKSTVNRVRAQKRDSGSDDELLREMVAQYQPEAASASRQEEGEYDASSRDSDDSEASSDREPSTADQREASR